MLDLESLGMFRAPERRFVDARHLLVETGAARFQRDVRSPRNYEGISQIQQRSIATAMGRDAVAG